MAPSTVPSASASFSERATAWASENRKVLVGVAAGAVVVGGGYYLYTVNQAPSRKPRKSASCRSKLSATAKDEEANPKPWTGGAKAAGTSAPPAGATKTEDPTLSLEAIAALPASKRKELAGELKSRGNKEYQARKYELAADLYTKAIACEERAVYYSNRAACYTHLKRPQDVIEDCNSALRLEQGYVKALNRRAGAYDALDEPDALFKAICDYTAVCIFEQFQNSATAKALETSLQRLSHKLTTRLWSEREPTIPSPSFVQAYLDAFRPRAKPKLPDSPSDGDKTLMMAFDALDAKDYPHATSLFHEAVEQGFSSNELHARALNMRGTLRFIMSQTNEALEDLEFSTNLEPNDSQTWVKKASVHMELGKQDEAMRDFEQALTVNPRDPDVFYHRGQVYFITEQWDKAIAEYKESEKLDNTFIFSQIQHAVALYKAEKKHLAAQTFRAYVRKHPNSPEVHNYYGELLLDREEYKEAQDEFEMSLSLERKKPGPLNILPMINKALCVYKWKHDATAAEELLTEALKTDPKSENALLTYAQVLQDCGRHREALSVYTRLVEQARNTREMEQWISMEQSMKAQIEFIVNYPTEAAKFGLSDTPQTNGTH